MRDAAKSKCFGEPGAYISACRRAKPDGMNRFKARAALEPARWIDIAISALFYEKRGNDFFVNHRDHDINGFVPLHSRDKITLNPEAAHDDVFSLTDDRHVTSAQSAGSANTGTCTAANSGSNGGPAYFLSTASYHAPATFFSGALDGSPTRRVRINGGARLNGVNGQAEMLRLNMAPGALDSRHLTVYNDVEFQLAREWAGRRTGRATTLRSGVILESPRRAMCMGTW